MPVSNSVNNQRTTDSPQPVHQVSTPFPQAYPQPPGEVQPVRLLTPEEKLAELAFWVSRGTLARLDGKVLRDSPFRTAHLSQFGSACADAWRQGWQAKDDSLAREDRRLSAQRRAARKSRSGTTRARRRPEAETSADHPAQERTPQTRPAKTPVSGHRPAAKRAS